MVKNRFGKNLWGSPKTTQRQRTKTPWQNARKWSRQAKDAPGILGRGRPRLVFLGSLMDVFEDHPDANTIRSDVWQLIKDCPNLDFQMLTKRPENILKMLPDDWDDGDDGYYPNVWLGTSVEDERVADRIGILAEVPANIRFISYEPALGPLAGNPILHSSRHHIHWIIYGGESGPKWRDHDLDWARDMRRYCRKHKIAFFYKQSAARFTETGTDLDGKTIQEFPKKRIRKLSNLPEPSRGKRAPKGQLSLGI